MTPPDPNAPVPSSVVAASEGSPPPELMAIAGLVQPFLLSIGEAMKADAEAKKADAEARKAQFEAQMHEQNQTTVRAGLAAGLLRPIFWCVFGIYTVIAAIAVICLFQGQAELTEKLVIALLASIVSLLAGLGIGRKSE